MENRKSMNIVLWTLQILLALYNLAGGIYMTMNYQNIANPWAWKTLPQPVWIILGILQVIFALGLVIPIKAKNLPNLVSISAIGLVIISLLGCVLYIEYSKFPGMLWGIIPAILTAFVSYKRWTPKSV